MVAAAPRSRLRRLRGLCSRPLAPARSRAPVGARGERHLGALAARVVARLARIRPAATPAPHVEAVARAVDGDPRDPPAGWAGPVYRCAGATGERVCRRVHDRSVSLRGAWWGVHTASLAYTVGADDGASMSVGVRLSPPRPAGAARASSVAPARRYRRRSNVGPQPCPTAQATGRSSSRGWSVAKGVAHGLRVGVIGTRRERSRLLGARSLPLRARAELVVVVSAWLGALATLRAGTR